MTTMTRSKDYLFTADLQDAESMLRIEEARVRAKRINAFAKADGDVRRVRIDVKPRLGKNNPNAHLYRGNRCYTVLMKHGKQFDVYVRWSLS